MTIAFAILGAFVSVAPAQINNPNNQTLVPLHDVSAQVRADGKLAGSFYVGGKWAGKWPKEMPLLQIHPDAAFAPGSAFWKKVSWKVVGTPSDAGDEGSWVDFVSDAALPYGPKFVAFTLEGRAENIDMTSFAATEIPLVEIKEEVNRQVPITKEPAVQDPTRQDLPVPITFEPLKARIEMSAAAFEATLARKYGAHFANNVLPITWHRPSRSNGTAKPATPKDHPAWANVEWGDSVPFVYLLFTNEEPRLGSTWFLQSGVTFEDTNDARKKIGKLDKDAKHVMFAVVGGTFHPDSGRHFEQWSGVIRKY